MYPSLQVLSRIAARASTLAERLAGIVVPDGVASSGLAETRLARWCHLAARGDQAQFARRLTWDGLDPATVPLALGPVSWAEGTPLPSWTTTLAAIMRAASALATELSEWAHRAFDPSTPLPFEELFVPFLLVAQQRLLKRAGPLVNLLAAPAHAALERSLLARLSYLCAETLALEFEVARALQRSSLGRLLVRGEGTEPSREQYETFIAGLHRDGLRAFFEEYSVLARRVALALDFWVEASTELLQRLHADLPLIQHTFGAGEPGQVVAVTLSLSDPHNEGRTVVVLTFASGLRLVYKPRPLGIESAWFRLLGWLNERGAPLPFKTLSLLERATHGWVEYVAPAPCQEAAQAARYYQRAGMLLALVYLLEGTDCHYENLVACGEHPVLVDLETLLHPWPREVTERGQEQLWDSVLRSGLLPRWEFGPDRRRAIDVSGLGGVADGETLMEVRRWQNINTDEMARGHGYGKVQPRANVPTLAGQPLSPNDYLAEIVEGFRAMGRFLMEQVPALLTPGSPLLALCEQPVRFIYRPTRNYFSLFDRTLDPKYLREGAACSIELELLSRPLLASSTERALFWPLLKIERQALEQGDIPFFTAQASSRSLDLASGERLEACFSQPAHERVSARLRRLTLETIEQQVGLIRSSFYSRVASKGAGVSERQAVLPDNEPPPLADEALLQQALEIARGLQQRAIRAADGSATWIGLEYVVEADRFHLQPLGPSLYDGASGVALFLGALAHLTGDTSMRALALDALRPLRALLVGPTGAMQEMMAAQLGIGGAIGLGSVLYALLRLSDFLGEPALLEEARQIARLLTPERIAADRSLDIVSGAAGAILGLLPLYQATFDCDILERARLCGQHLLQQRVESAAGPRTWATLEGRALTGFAHGAAGIALALLRLHAVTAEPGLREAALEGIAYERSTFCETAGNWPDLRASSEEGHSFMMGWCSGAPGIALARLGALPHLDDAATHQEITIALESTRRHGAHGVDHLCCGTAGRAEALLVAAQRLNRPELLEEARRQMSSLLRRAEARGGFALLANLPVGAYNPGLFQGVAGIGYTLLRVLEPDHLPSILLWE